MTSKEFLKVMTELQKSKKSELNRRTRQSRYLRKRSDEAYEKKNNEMHEAYEECIKYHQQKMIVLICEIGKIEQFFNNLDTLKEGPLI